MWIPIQFGFGNVFYSDDRFDVLVGRGFSVQEPPRNGFVGGQIPSVGTKNNPIHQQSTGRTVLFEHVGDVIVLFEDQILVNIEKSDPLERSVGLFGDDLGTSAEAGVHMGGAAKRRM